MCVLLAKLFFYEVFMHITFYVLDTLYSGHLILKVWTFLLRKHYIADTFLLRKHYIADTFSAVDGVRSREV